MSGTAVRPGKGLIGSVWVTRSGVQMVQMIVGADDQIALQPVRRYGRG